MNTISTPNIMMIGPSRAGKTTLLSVLRLAATRNGKVKIKPISQAAKELFERALGIVDEGGIVHGATTEATKYVFELHCSVEIRVKVERFEDEPGMFPWSTSTRVDRSFYKMVDEEKVFTLTVLDGRGGDIFGERDPMEDVSEYNRRRTELVELATQSMALIICVNACDNKATGLFFRGLQRFLDEVHGNGARTPFERVSIALTQADRLVEEFGSSAQIELEKRDPACAASEALGFYAKSGLFQALEADARNNVYTGWVSVYGFIPEEGSVNFNSETSRVAIFRQDDAKWTDDWHPYGVIEPFLFACTGKATNLVRVVE